MMTNGRSKPMTTSRVAELIRRLRRLEHGALERAEHLAERLDELLAGVAAGIFRDVHEAVTACVRLADAIEPDPQWSAAYDHGYRRFQALYPALRPLEDA